jgi:hypothetical protein
LSHNPLASNLNPQMKKNILKQYAKLRTSLEQECAALLARLQEIDAALGGAPATSTIPLPAPAQAPAPAPAKGNGKRKMSAAGRAAIAAAAKARWAKVNAAK